MKTESKSQALGMATAGSQQASQRHVDPMGLETDLIHQITEHKSSLHVDTSNGAKQASQGHMDPMGLETDIIHQATMHKDSLHSDVSTQPDMTHRDDSQTATDIINHDIRKHSGS